MDPHKFRNRLMNKQLTNENKSQSARMLQNIPTEDLKRELKRRKKANENWRNF